MRKSNLFLLPLLPIATIPVYSLTSCNKQKDVFTYSENITFSPNKEEAQAQSKYSFAYVNFKWNNAKPGDILYLTIDSVDVIAFDKHIANISVKFTGRDSYEKDFQRQVVKAKNETTVGQISCFYTIDQETPIEELLTVSIIFNVKYIRGNHIVKSFKTGNVFLETGRSTTPDMLSYLDEGQTIVTGINYDNEEWKNWRQYSILSIPSTVKEIRSEAFNYVRLEEEKKYTNFQFLYWELDDNLNCEITTIGDHAFYGQGFADCITIPEKVTTIGPYAFAENYYAMGLIFVNKVGGTQLTIGESAFENNILMGYLNPYLELPLGTTTIGDNAFRCPEDRVYLGNWYLTDISLPATIEQIGVNAFTNLFGVNNLNLSQLDSQKIIDNVYGFDSTFESTGTMAENNPIVVLPGTADPTAKDRMLATLREKASLSTRFAPADQNYGK